MNSDGNTRSKVRWIKPLPERVINKIAAGEVIERPASVLKELVENSIDSGATRIDITVEKSGIKLIKVVDDGCGIDPDQIEIAFSRHATSKIRGFDDLDELASYGFRGEALPSIASVSRLTMVSRPHAADSGSEIVFEGGVLQSNRPAPAQRGTSVEVENLFFNTPARRKFLKSEATESRHLSRAATALAMGRFQLGFSFTGNGRRFFSLPTGSTLKERAAALLGADNTFIRVSGESPVVSIEGYIGMPDEASGNRNGQFLFVNNRFIFSAVLSHALAAGYGELLQRGRHPISVLLLSVKPDEVDVNVHPAKTEVRLAREREIYDAIRRLVADSLRAEGVIPVIRTSDNSSLGTGQGRSGSQSQFQQKRPGNVIPGVSSGEQSNLQMLSELYRSTTAVPAADSTDLSGSMKVDRETGEILSETPSAAVDASVGGPAGGFRLIGRFSDLYLLLQAQNDLYIVDQHTAHERVLYEETMVRMDNSSAAGQSLLFPVQLELSAEQFSLFEESAAMLNQSGFAAASFGGRTVKVEAVPTILGKKTPETVFLKILDDIGSLKSAGHELKKAIAQSIACRSAVMSGDRISDAEATHLLEQLLKCDNPYTCPHGRPTFIKFGRRDLDRQFGRG